LWDRFGWGPRDTEMMTLPKMRELFAVLEQQRVSRDAVEKLGAPNAGRIEKHVQQLQALESIKRQKSMQEQANKERAAQTGTSPKQAEQ
jgi:hypothetical protein